MTDAVTRDQLIAETLPDYRRWLYAVATDMLAPGSPLVDDLAQEGAIAMWRAFDRHDPDKGALASWLTGAARYRMLDIVTRHARYTGTPQAEDVVRTASKGRETRDRMRAYLRANPDATGRQIAAALGISPAGVTYHRQRLLVDDLPPAGEASLDELLDVGFDPADAGDVLDQIIEGYHEGQVAEALNALTPAERRYVHLRFWEGMAHSELVAAFGYNPGGLWRTARARLAPILADLVAA